MEYKRIKRVLDIMLAVNGLIVVSPILLVTAILVKADSDGPIIFKQSRTGKYGKTFDIYKFRTMVCGNDVYNFEEVDKVTGVGKVLRKYGIDELPQLLNIIKGDMSFIGPRPYPLKYFDYFTEDQKRRFDVLPGILGPSTCQYKDLSILEKNELDCSYVDIFSFKQDLDIIKFAVCNLGKILSSRDKGASGNKDVMKNDFVLLKSSLQKEESLEIENCHDMQVDDIKQEVAYSCDNISLEECVIGDNNLSEIVPKQKKIGVRRYNK